MSTIRQHAEDYLTMRRALGFKLTTFGQKLLSFVDYLEAHEASVLTTDAALAWATATPRSSGRPRPGHRGSPDGSAGPPLSARHPIPVHAGRDHFAADRGRIAATRAERVDLPHPDRSACHHRHAHW
jgi:hypothetical protein